MNISEIRQELHKNQLEQRRLIALLEQNLGEMAHHNEPKACKQILFNDEEDVPLALRDLLSLPDEKMTRAAVTRHFYEYLKDNNLIDKKKRRILLDEEMKEMFGKVDLTFYNIQQHLNTLYD